jgi:predicted DCC family thiol-disulfide oxidoreductase YuxK
MKQDHPVVLFDGICNYCNSWVNFAIRNDKNARLRFATLQSATGQKLKEKYGVAPTVDSVILIDNDRAYTYSDAALRIAKYLRWPAKALYALIIVPAFIRQPIYKWIARNRYKWFGKKDACMVPSAEIRGRFL